MSAWLQEASKNGDNNFDDSWNDDLKPDTSPARAVRAIGTDALPTLMNMVRSRYSPLRERFVELCQKHPWVPIHPSGFDAREEMALYGFAWLGPSAKSAVPELTALLDDENWIVRSCAAFCLGKIGRASASAVPELQKHLETAALDTRRNQAERDGEAENFLYALGEIGPAAHPALTQIMAFTNAAEVDTVGSAKAALIKITGNGLAPAVEALKDTSNPTNLWVASSVLKFLGSNAIPAIPLLLADLQETNQLVQAEAILALGRMHSQPDQCLPAIAPFLRSTNKNVRYWSLSSIAAFGTNATRWVPTSEIIRCLADPTDGARRQATNALRRIDPEAAVQAGVK